MNISGAKILCECLLEQGVDTVFGFPGGQIINVYDELYKYSDRINHIITSHEQGASHAADGYARVTGRVGVCIATSGPGATNLVTGIATAYMDSIPVVFITGNVAVPLLGRDSFQEVDTAGITMPITKHNYIVKDITTLAETIREAFLIARSGRPGPVLIDLPKDIQVGTTEYEFIPQNTKVEYEKNYSIADIEKIVELIDASEKPLIYAGGGIIAGNATDVLVKLSEKGCIPVSTSFMGKGGMPQNHKNYIGMIGMHGNVKTAKATTQCDLLIVMGARFSDRVAGNRSKFARNAKIIHIDIDESEIDKNVTSHYSLIGNIKDILSDIAEKIATKNVALYTDEIKDREYEKNDKFSPKNILELLKSKTAENAIVATDVGQHQMWTSQYFNINQPRCFLSSGGLGTMGYGLGAAIGARAATIEDKKREIYLITGDGSFHMNLNELSTCVNLDLPVTIIIMNNNVLGMVRQWQKLFFEDRFSNTTLYRKTDYVKLADAFGAIGYRARTLDELKDILDKKDNSKTNVIEVIIDPDENVLPMIPPGKSANEIITEMNQ
jgi:acetolactate synthase-1/2/3 large subunit